VTLRLTIDPAAAPGTIALTVAGRAPISLPMTVRPGLTALWFAGPAGEWQAGTTVTTTLRATVAPGVTDVGTVTLPLRNGDLWITSYPDTCRPVGATAITCAAVSVTKGVASFGSLSVTLLPAADGEQTVTTTRPGGRRLPVTGANDTTMTATPLAPDGPIAITGFDGAIVGAAGQYCASADRISCIDQQSPGASTPTSWQHLDRSVALPDALSGKKVVLARLTWAVSFPGTTSLPDTPSIADLAIDGGTPVSVPGTRVDIDQAGTSRDSAIVQYTADLADPALLARHHTVSVSGIAPTDQAPWQGPGHGYGHQQQQPAMVAWTLSIVWADPDSPTTVRLYSNPALLDGTGANDPSTWTEPDPAAGRLEHLATALWGVDDLGSKQVAAGSTTLDQARATWALPGLDPSRPCSPLLGLIESPDGTDSCASVGFGLLGIGADPQYLGSDTSGPITVTSSSDTIWVSTVLVVRSAAGN
jgi:hypothetical protein